MKWLALLIGLFVAVPSTMFAEEVKTIESQKIWDAGPHNAFTDLIRWKGRFYCTFRESTGHVPHDHDGDGKVRVIASDDGKTWESVDLLTKKDVDLRDSKLSITPDGRLMACMGGSYYEKGKLLKRVSQVAFMSDPEKGFGPVTPVVIDEKIRSNDDWLWRVTWKNGVGYGVVYQDDHSNQWGLHLVKTTDGVHYDLVSTLDRSGRPNETTVRFTPDGEMLLVVRKDSGNGHGYFGRAKAPYTDWTWHDMNARLGGPDAIQLPNKKWILGTRFYPVPGQHGCQTGLMSLDAKGQCGRIIRFPSGGHDTGYPGLCIHDGKLWVSYYSSHEGKTSIYLATITLEQF